MNKKILKKVKLGEKVFSLLNKKNRKKNDILSILREIKKKHNIPRRSFREKISELYFPSFKNFLVFAAIIATFFLLSRLSFGRIPQESNTYQNLVTILAGISAIIFALMIFIAGSSHEGENTDKMRVLLKESYLFPLVSVVILAFIILLLGYANSFTVVLIILICILAIFSIYRIIRTLLNKYLFFQKRTELLKERFKQSISWEIDKRLGNNILLSNLEKEIKLVFNPIAKDENKCYVFRSQKSGVIININLEKLKEFSELLEKEANRNGKSFNKDSVIEESENIDNKINKPPNKIPLDENRNRYLLKGFRETVDEAHNEIICIDKELIKEHENQDIFHELERLVKDCFTIKKSHGFSEEVSIEIEGLRDQFIKALRNGLEFSELEGIYISLAEAFLENISKYGGYSLEQARKERGSLFGGFREMGSLSSDVREFLEEAAKTKDIKIIYDVFYLPIAIAHRAIDYKEQYIFQEFVEFTDYLYFYALKMEDKDLRNGMVDHAWRYLKELGDFYITPRLMASSSNENDLKIYEDFAIYLFYPFQKMLKESFDNIDFESFKQFADATLNLFSNFQPKEGSIFENVSNELDLRKKQMLFGVASWIFNKFSQDRSELQLKKFYETVRDTFNEDIEEFTEIFISCSFDVIAFWGWDFWEIDGSKEGEMHFITFPTKLKQFFVVNALSILSQITDKEILSIKLPYNNDFAFLIGDKNSDLNKTLDDIQNNPESWKYILSDEAISKIDSFRELLGRVKLTQEEKNSVEKRQKTISVKKIEEFKEEVVKNFYEQAIVRQIFKYYNLYQDKTQEVNGDKKHKYGFLNFLDDKAAFFEKWYEHYLDWGKGYGGNLASSENSFLLDKIIKDCTKISESEFEDKLHNSLNPSDLIIFATSPSLSRQFFLNSNKSILKWRINSQSYKDLQTIDLPSFEGYYEFNGVRIPIFEIFYGKANGSVLIIDKSKLGYLIQYSPINNKNEKKLLKDIFYINVQPLDEKIEIFEKIIKEQPMWLVKKFKEEEKQRLYLQEFAVIDIYESFEYSKAQNFLGYIFTPR